MDNVAAADTGSPGAVLEGIRVLAVDEDAASRSALQAMLSGWGTETVAAGDSEAALAAFGQAAADRNPFALVILDVRISGGTALELAQHLRGPGLTGPAIVLLASADEVIAAEEFSALGIRECLRKPLQPSALMQAITASMASESLKRLIEFSAQGPRRVLHILVAGANPANQQLLLQMLERRGHSVVLVSGGREAVEATSWEEFDVVLLEVLMPGMSGFEATAAIRAREYKKEERSGMAVHLAILATPASATPGEQERCLAAGMDGYIAKPFHPDELFETVEKLSIIKASAPAVTFDGTLFEGDPEFLAEIASLFLETYPGLMSTIEDAFSRGDAVGLGKAAHTMKGAVANFGAAAVVEQAKALEMIAKNGDLSSARQAVSSLQSLLARFKPVLQLALKRATEEQVVM
jgi:two-component system sensor histidine kinase/response regulator